MADGVSIRTIGRKKHLARRRQLVPSLQKQAATLNRKSAEEMASIARRLAPKRTGDLSRSIVVTFGGRATPPHSQPGGSTFIPKGAAAVTAGNRKVRYPHLVEYGTQNAPAQPYFWPAYRITRRNHITRAKSIGILLSNPGISVPAQISGSGSLALPGAMSP